MGFFILSFSSDFANVCNLSHEHLEEKVSSFPQPSQTQDPAEKKKSSTTHFKRKREIDQVLKAYQIATSQCANVWI